MADPFGLSFSPSAQQPGAPGSPNQGGTRPTPIQQAIQTLSLHIPRVAGASAFTAQPLLTAAGGSALGGSPNDALLLEQLRRLLFGGGSAPGLPDQGLPPTPDSMGGRVGTMPFPNYRGPMVPEPTPAPLPEPIPGPGPAPLPRVTPGGGSAGPVVPDQPAAPSIPSYFDDTKEPVPQR